MVYAYYQSDSKDLAKAEKEFFHSIEKAADLYHYLLQLILAETDYAYQRIDAARNKYLPTQEEKNPNTRFIDNAFATQLAKNNALKSYLNNTKMSWVNNDVFVKNIYETIQSSDFYTEYMNAPKPRTKPIRNFGAKSSRTSFKKARIFAMSSKSRIFTGTTTWTSSSPL